MKKYTLDDFFAGKISVVARTDNETKILLQECERRGIRWVCGEKATKFIPPVQVYKIVNGVLCFCYSGDAEATVGDLLKHRNYKIIIDCDGDTTTAQMLIDGKAVKTAKAKRNPDDKFNWKMGAELAFNRLFGQEKTTKPAKQPGVFKVGDRVVCIDDEDENRVVKNAHGRVACLEGGIYKDWIGVEFDKDVGGHSLFGRAKEDHGYYIQRKNLRHE